MSINIDYVDQTIIVLIDIQSNFTFLRWSRICDDRPLPFASMWYNPPKKFNSHVYNSIMNIQSNTT